MKKLKVENAFANDNNCFLCVVCIVAPEASLLSLLHLSGGE